MAMTFSNQALYRSRLRQCVFMLNTSYPVVVLDQPPPDPLQARRVIRRRVQLGVPGDALGAPGEGCLREPLHHVRDLVDDRAFDLVLEQPFVVGVGPAGVRALHALQDFLFGLDPVVVGAVHHLHDVLREAAEAVGEGAVESRLTERAFDGDHDRGVAARRVVRAIVLGTNADSFFPDFLDRSLVREGNGLADDAQDGDVP